MAERSRREQKSKLDKLAEYKRLREGGKRAREEEDTDLYDEVTEDQYKSIVKGRLQKDDFVVDDGVDGYMDNGMDDWGDASESEEEQERERPRNKKKDTSKLKKPAKPKPKPEPQAAPDISAYRPAVTAAQEDDFMSSLLGNMDSMPTEIPKVRKRKPSPDPYHDDHSSSPIRASSSSDGFNEAPPTSDDFVMSPTKKPRMDDSDFDSSFETSFNDIDMDAFMDVDNADLDVKPQIKDTKQPLKTSNSPSKPPAVNGVKKTVPAVDSKPTWLSFYDSLNTSVPQTDTLGTLSSTATPKSSNISALEPDGSMRFFWIDYLEDKGKVYFIGKLKDKTTGSWVSCCVTVENLQRNLFVLPQEKRVELGEDEEVHETDEVPEYMDVYNDFDVIRKQYNIKSFKAKQVKRKYAFGEADVPRDERTWMKVVYPFSDPEIPFGAWSPNISRIFGCKTSAFELLVLKRKIMGPCWLQIKNPTVDSKGISWCKFEVTVSDPKDINPFKETDAEAPKETPPLNTVSLSIRTIINHKENKREIVCASARIWKDMVIDDPTPPEQLPCTVLTYVRPLDRFPPRFEAIAKANGKGVITPVKNERVLLNSLLVSIYKSDPDVIVGHDFLDVSFDTLLNRMRDLKADNWSRIGRFRRSGWPHIGKQGTNMRFLNGRMLCDLGSEGAKSMIVSTTWSLTEMCKTHLKVERQDIDPDDTASYFDGSVSSPDRLMDFVRHCELDAHFQMAIAARVQILPLTKQLTNLAGNAWNKTLNGGRAERNEYILLHEFHKLKYICPDKTFGKKSAAVLKSADDEGDPDSKGKSGGKSKRDKYKGGLVLPPIRGLHDKYILVMDFNSLYPSIIQEYNIDFTTVSPIDHEGAEEDTQPPSSDVAQGVLPRLIATLVNRRRQVKSLMKDKTASQAKRLQWDIKQMALKLTANSMYGCLGFEYSRFYARPLAALTTSKGREILMHTKELAESLGLQVVYGDTDSVFVNSNETELDKALKISADFKKAVNESYRLLEIDLDGIFQRLLLLQKKKYAALKVEEGDKTSIEIKGLDMKRREYSVLSKRVSQFVLDQILSGEATEVVVDNIHEYLSQTGQDVRAGKVALDEFIINKRLGKNPEDYPDAKSQPHVQVAMRLKAKGGHAKSGDVIPYIFCVDEEKKEASKSGQADRARHPEDLRKADSTLRIDFDFYLSHQVLPPIERLCDSIEGTDRARLAECLGLDPAKYRSTVTTSEDHAFSSLDSQISDEQRFKECVPFSVRCRKCEVIFPFAPLHGLDPTISRGTGPKCSACQAPLTTASLQCQLECQIREAVSRYYESWTVCEDQTCGYRTRMVNLNHRRCLRPTCESYTALEYTDTDLYNQLRYLSTLFDVKRALDSPKSVSGQDAMAELLRVNAEFMDVMSETVNRFLDSNARRWVGLTDVFSFMRL